METGRGFLFVRARGGRFCFYPFEKRKEIKKMKTKLFAMLLTLAMLLALVSCATPAETPEESETMTEIETVVEKKTEARADSGVPAEGVWKDAAYREDQTFGNGAKTIKVTVKAENASVTFTVKTDKENLADALLEHKLVEGEDGAYGLYIKKVNGMLADYDVNQTYWSFQIDGVAQMSGVSDAKIQGGESFELVYAK